MIAVSERQYGGNQGGVPIVTMNEVWLPGEPGDEMTHRPGEKHKTLRCQPNAVSFIVFVVDAASLKEARGIKKV